MLLDDLLVQERAGKVQLQPFAYSAVYPIAAFVAGATVVVNVPINNDSDFVWRYTAVIGATAAGTPFLLPGMDFTVQWFDSGSGRNFQDQPRHIQNCAGSGQFPYILPEPLRIAAASVLVCTLTNNAAGPAVLVTLEMAGMKVFNLQRYARS